MKFICEDYAGEGTIIHVFEAGIAYNAKCVRLRYFTKMPILANPFRIKIKVSSP